MASEGPGFEDDREGVLAAELIEGGSELAGAATGAALGLLGGPVAVVGGAVAGAAVGRVLKRVGADIKQRMLGPREEIRIGAAVAFAGDAIQQLVAAGRQPRNDGFFEPDETGHIPADEILEGVLLRARDAYEEKKVRLLGILFAKIAFHPEISPAHANHLIALADRLTYRQLVVLAVAQDETNRGRLRPRDYRGDNTAIEKLGLEGIALLTESYELYQQGLLAGSDGSAWISVADVNPGGMRLQGSGAVLAQLMALDVISTEDRERIYQLLGPASD